MKDRTLGLPAKRCYFQQATEHLTELLSGKTTKSELTVDQPLNRLSLFGDFEILYANRIDSLRAFHHVLRANDNLFLQPAYLQLMEDFPPRDMEFVYLLFKKKGKVVGFASGQILNFNLKETLFSENTPDQGYWRSMLNQFANQFSFKLLVCGTTTVTGQHGFFFDSAVAKEQIPTLLTKGFTHYMKNLDSRISTLMIKDLEQDNETWQQESQNGAFSQVTFQPNMIFEVEESWKNDKDYLDAMTSKYRVRAKRARKKAKAIKQRNFSLEDIDYYEDQLYKLYLDIAGKADFNMITLHPGYLKALKERLKDRYTMTGYFLGERLVGFCTTIDNGDELEAHFLGVEQEANFEYQLYLNMLYDMVKQGIEKKSIKRIIFGRTASEIKSSVGARAQHVFCYFRHRNTLINKMIPTLISWFEPKIEWTPRHPFGH